MLAPEAGGDGTFFERVVDRVGRPEELLQHDVHPAHHFGEEEVVAGFVKRGLLAFVPASGTGEAEIGRRWTCGECVGSRSVGQGAVFWDVCGGGH